MNIYLSIFLNILFGILGGILGGLGMGGGTVLIPLLSIFLGFNQKLSQGINLLSFLVMSLFSLIIHYHNNFLVLKNISWIVFSGIIFSLLGSFLASKLPGNIMRILFGIFLCFLSIIEVVKLVKNKK